MKSGSAFEKGAALRGLSSTQDEAVYARLMDMALNDEEFITGRQANGLVGGFLGSDKFGDQTWDWFKTNFTAFVNKRVPDVRKGTMPGFANGFCSAGKAVEVKDFFESNAEVIPGYQRSLKQTLESIELCAAFKDEMARPLQTALAKR